MTESILKALMRLYAVVTQVLPDDKHDMAKGIVESYLRQLVNPGKVNQYLLIYHFYNKDFVERSKRRIKEKDSLFSVKALIICEQVNKVILQRQKVLFLLQLFDILSLKKNITEHEFDFIHTLAIALNFQESVFNDCKSFILETIDHISGKGSVLLIDRNRKSDFEGIKHLQNEYLKGKIVFLYIQDTNSYVFRHIENDDQLYLNGRKIIPERTYIFEKGSSIRSPIIGTIHHSDIVKSYLGSEVDFKLNFRAINLEFQFKNSSNGIYPFSFNEDSGQLIGIMGGSGVGKSTLLNLLNGNLMPRKGKVLINGYDVHHEKDKIKGIIGYIPQDDLLIEELTVFQNLYFNAKLCFNNLPEKQIKELVNKVLFDLDLYEIRNLTVGNPLHKFISGGQRKRLNISLELIREPYILFVDEPTSGLSSTDSEMVMDLLKEQAQKGKLVIVNIHQPSSDIFKLFDKLMILDKGGRIVYNGNPVDALVYFKTSNQLINADEGECLTCGNLNPEQILQILEAREVNEFGEYTNERILPPAEWYRLYKKNIEPKFKVSEEVKTKLPSSLFNIPNKFKQFKIFSLRNLLSKIADKQYLLINLLEAPLLAFILGIFTKYNSGTDKAPNAYIFSENINLPVYIFMGVIVALFLGMMVSAEEIIRDRRIIQRESFLNLSKFSYYNSKIVLLIFLSAIQSFSFVLIGNAIMEIREMSFQYWLVLFSASVFSNILGLNISDSMKSIVSIYILIPLLLVPQILLGGAMVKFDKLNKNISSQQYVPFIGNLMVSRWGYEALSVYQFRYNEYEKHFYEIEKQESVASFKMNYLVPELQLKLNIVRRYVFTDMNRQLLNNELEMLKNELTIIAGSDPKIPLFTQMTKLNFDNFTLRVADELETYLSNLKKYYSKMLDKAINNKDQKLSELDKKLGGNHAVVKLRQEYYNDNLAEMVLNKSERDKILQENNRFIQKAEPIFYIPESRYGKAHFFAPEKRVGNFLIDTYWFNLLVIWIMNIVLYLFLQFSIIKNFVNFLGNIGTITKSIRTKKYEIIDINS